MTEAERRMTRSKIRNYLSTVALHILQTGECRACKVVDGHRGSCSYLEVMDDITQKSVHRG